MNANEPFRRFRRARGPGPLISIHRGLWGDGRPENSLAAIAAAAPRGIVEIDVQLSADGVPMVFHDPVLDRMTGAGGPLAERSAADLTALALRADDGGAAAPLTDQRLASLRDVLDRAPRDAFFDFDAKNPGEVEAIAAAIAAMGGQARGSVKIDVANAGDIDDLLGLQARHGVMVMAKVMLPEVDPGLVGALARAGVAAAEVAFGDLGELSAACEAAGEATAISTYTLDPVHCMGLSDSHALADPDAVWGRIIDAGASIVMTDRANELERYLRRTASVADQV